MEGKLSQYPNPNPNEPGLGPLPMFLSGDTDSTKVVVFVAGLTNTLLSVPYVPPLSDTLKRKGWSLCQLLTSSSGYGFTQGSLDRDVTEMSSAVSELRRLGCVGVAGK